MVQHNGLARSRWWTAPAIFFLRWLATIHGERLLSIVMRGFATRLWNSPLARWRSVHFMRAAASAVYPSPLPPYNNHVHHSYLFFADCASGYVFIIVSERRDNSPWILENIGTLLDCLRDSDDSFRFEPLALPPRTVTSDQYRVQWFVAFPLDWIEIKLRSDKLVIC